MTIIIIIIIIVAIAEVYKKQGNNDRFNFLTVPGMYAELQPRRDRIFSNERACSVYFKGT